MTLTQGHGCDIDKHKFACLQDKVRTTQPITTKLGSDIPLVMPITWLDFGWILLETLFFFAKFSLKISDVFFQGQTLYWTFLRYGWFDWCETKRRCIGWILGELCDLDLWLHPWLWPCIFKVKVSNSLIAGCPAVREKSGKFQTWQKSGNFVEGQGKNEYREKSGNLHLLQSK